MFNISKKIKSSASLQGLIPRKHLHSRYNSLLRHRFWEIAAATIEERLRQYGSKTRLLRPKKNGAWPHFAQGFALLYLLKRLLRRLAPRNARSAFLTVFSLYSLRHAREEKKGTGYFFSKKETVSTHGQNNRKSSLLY